MSRNRGSYETLVTAETAEEAIAIAAEAIPKGAELTASDARAVEGETDTTFLVTLKFRRTETGEGGY